MGQGRILIIGDDEEMVALGRLILEKQGYQVLAATDGAAGLDMLAQDRADLVLLDIMADPVAGSGHMDGWNVLKRIQANERLAHIPVIVLTARRDPEGPPRADARIVSTARAVETTVAYPFASTIAKPFVLSHLLGEIHKALVGSPGDAVDGSQPEV